MAKLKIFESTEIYEGDFLVSVSIDALISELTGADFELEGVSENGIVGLSIGADLHSFEYREEPYDTLCSIWIHVPDSVRGSFSIKLRDQDYPVTNRLENHYDHHHIVGLSETENIRIVNPETLPVFRYDTRDF